MATDAAIPTFAPDDSATSLRERKKDATRRALAERALHLATQRGYAHFTISELVNDVGVSRRTFSNYFTSKAECIAAVTDGWLDDVLTFIRDAAPGAKLTDVLQAGLMEVARQGSARWGLLQPLVEQEPEIAAQIIAFDETVVGVAATEIAQCAELDGDDIRVHLLASFAVAAGREVMIRWTASGQQGGEAELGRMLEQAFSILDPSGLQ